MAIAVVNAHASNGLIAQTLCQQLTKIYVLPRFPRQDYTGDVGGTPYASHSWAEMFYDKVVDDGVNPYAGEVRCKATVGDVEGLIRRYSVKSFFDAYQGKQLDLEALDLRATVAAGLAYADAFKVGGQSKDKAQAALLHAVDLVPHSKSEVGDRIRAMIVLGWLVSDDERIRWLTRAIDTAEQAGQESLAFAPSYQVIRTLQEENKRADADPKERQFISRFAAFRDREYYMRIVTDYKVSHPDSQKLSTAPPGPPRQNALEAIELQVSRQ